METLTEEEKLAPVTVSVAGLPDWALVGVMAEIAGLAGVAPWFALDELPSTFFSICPAIPSNNCSENPNSKAMARGTGW